MSRFADDDGSAEPGAAAALAAFAAGRASEHDAVQALSRTRMLVPVVAAEAAGRPAGEGGSGAAAARQAGAARAGAARAGPADAASVHRSSEMSVPTLVGRDGRRAVLAFTSVAALGRWRAGARPVPTAAIDVWRAAVADDCAVVIDVAGPMPLAVDGARLRALALGEPAPPPQQDPDVITAVRAAGAGQPGVTAVSLAAGTGSSDLVVRLTLAPGLSDRQRKQAAGAVAEAVLGQLGARLRRGIAVAIETAG
jgi:hypothetical protein